MSDEKMNIKRECYVLQVELEPQQLHARTPVLIMILKTEGLLIMNGPIQFIVF